MSLKGFFKTFANAALAAVATAATTAITNHSAITSGNVLLPAGSAIITGLLALFQNPPHKD